MASLAASLPKIGKSTIILFPGQGNQYVGMANNLCDKARALFDIANQVLGYDLLKLCQQGPQTELDKTIHSQPATFVSSLAAVENLSSMSSGAVENCKATAGFSVGEFAALVFAQSMDFVDALKLIKLRAEVTQTLSESVPSGIMTVIYGRDANVKQACAMAREFCQRSGVDRESSVCTISTHLFPHAKVVAGHLAALDFIEQNGRDFGIKRTKRLAVAGAFHTDIMKPAREDLRKALSKMVIKPPKIKVYSNVDASVYTNADQIRVNLEKHVYKPVMWEQIVHKLYDEAFAGPKSAAGEAIKWSHDTDSTTSTSKAAAATMNATDTSSEQADLPITFECGPQNSLTTILGMINLKAKSRAYNIEP